MKDLTGPVVGQIIESFGGLAKMAKALGYRHSSTIFAWQKKARIPHWRIEAIRAAASRHGVNLPPELAASLPSEAA